MSVSPSLYGPIWAAMAAELDEAGRTTPRSSTRRIQRRLFGAAILASGAADPGVRLRPSLDNFETTLRAFTNETTGPARSHCFAALAMIPALRSSASSSTSRTR